MRMHMGQPREFQSNPSAGGAQPGSALEVLRVFLRLGLTSFGGPIAHLAYFREELVARRRWLDDAQYAQLLALCQFLPGPASSQLGFALGLQRAGWAGALAAFIGFTMPSALAMFCIAMTLPQLLDSDGGRGVLHGLKLVAVVVVAHGLWGMARSLTPDAKRIGTGLVAMAAALTWPGLGGQLMALLLGLLAGLLLCRTHGANAPTPMPAAAVAGPTLPAALAAAALFVAGLAWALWPQPDAAPLQSLLMAHYQAGALVFGGGHVVLPLLDAQLVGGGQVGADDFLAGYGAAQAVPGPMFSLASFLGAIAPSGAPAWLASALATLCLFAPGLLLLVAALPLWQRMAAAPALAAAMAGVGAAVVGLLASVLYRPLWTSGVHGMGDVLTIVVGLLLCLRLRRPVLAVLPWCVASALLRHWL